MPILDLTPILGLAVIVGLGAIAFCLFIQLVSFLVDVIVGLGAIARCFFADLVAVLRDRRRYAGHRRPREAPYRTRYDVPSWILAQVLRKSKRGDP